MTATRECIGCGQVFGLNYLVNGKCRLCRAQDAVAPTAAPTETRIREAPLMDYRVTQSFNDVGLFGVAMLVGGTAASLGLYLTSMQAYAEAASSSLSFVAADAHEKLYSPWLYAALSVVSLIGLVMVIVGRQYRMIGAASK